MLATEIIAKMKKKIRRMWAAIIALALLLVLTNAYYTSGAGHRCEECQKGKLVYDIPQQPDAQNTVYKKKAKKR